MPARYRKQPVEVEAVQWRGDAPAVIELTGEGHIDFDDDGTLLLWVAANDAWLRLDIGEWVLRDRHGCYPCKNDVFLETYRLAEDD